MYWAHQLNISPGAAGIVSWTLVDTRRISRKSTFIVPIPLAIIDDRLKKKFLEFIISLFNVMKSCSNKLSKMIPLHYGL